MVPVVAFGNLLSSAAAGLAAHKGRPRSYGFDVKSCGHVEHMYHPGQGVESPCSGELTPCGWGGRARQQSRMGCGTAFPRGATGPSSGATDPGLLSRAWPSASRRVGPGGGRFYRGGSQEGRADPGHFGCCHGVGQPTRAVLSWAQECIGRLALWESAVAIEVALGVALENQAAIREKAAEATPGEWGVWDGSGNRPAKPPPNPPL